MSEKMSIHEAAQRLGMSDQTLRLFIQNGLFPFGVAASRNGGRKTYYVNRTQLEHYLAGGETNGV